MPALIHVTFRNGRKMSTRSSQYSLHPSPACVLSIQSLNVDVDDLSLSLYSPQNLDTVQANFDRTKSALLNGLNVRLFRVIFDSSLALDSQTVRGGSEGECDDTA